MNRWIVRLRNNRDSLVIVSVLLMLCWDHWRRMSPSNDNYIDALQYNPSGYRLWTQFLIMLDQHPIAYVAWVAILFVPVSWYLYIESPKVDRMMMFAWLALTIAQGSIRQGPAFLLLALAIILGESKWSYLMVVPMTIVKEHAGLVYIIYLLSMKKYKAAVGVGVLWAVTFLSIRLLIGPLGFYFSPVYGMSLNTPILTLEPYIVRLSMLDKQILVVGIIVLCVLFLKDRTEILMVLANLPIITIFGLFYEPQLWLMIMVAIVYRRRVNDDIRVVA